MVTVRLHYQDKTLTGIESRGHACFSYRGNDVVCAAVSVLMQALILGLEEVAEVQGLSVESDRRVPVIRVMWPVSEQEKISLLTETTALSLKQIAQENPKYVKISTEEISNDQKV
ncbi:MAG: ribosomal-processing cysteine protease Prp [Synergistaceae bacterium]|nr:ribosomal-processing cysteine protease Prp [Synergistaceae bacterium]